MPGFVNSLPNFSMPALATLPTPVVTVKVATAAGSPAATVDVGSVSAVAPTNLSSPQALGLTPATPTYSGAAPIAAFTAPSAPSAPTYGIYTAAPTIPTISVPTFSSTRPEAAYLDANVSAGLSTLSPPVISTLARTQLASIADLTYSPEPLSLFDAEAPKYTPFEPTKIELDAVELLDVARLNFFLDDLGGETGLIDGESSYTPLYDERVAYIELEELRAKEKTFSAAAARGFSLPTGSMSSEIAAIAESGTQKRRLENNKAYEEFVPLARRNFSSAVSMISRAGRTAYSVALERVAQQIKVLRLNVQMGVEVYNAAVDAYNNQARVVREYVGAYRAYVSALATQDEGVVAQIALARAALQTQQAEWSMYGDQLNIEQAHIDVGRLSIEQKALVLKEFEQKVRAYQQNAELAKLNIQALGEHTKVLNDKVQVELSALEMSRDQAESAASQFAVAEANVGAYASFLEADAARIQAYSRSVADGVSTLNALADEYRDYGQAHISNIQAQAAAVSATASMNRAALSAVDSIAQAQAAIQSANADVGAANSAKNLAVAEFNMRVQAIAAQAFAEQTRIDAGLMAAQATAAAGVAQAAASTLSVSARISDDGNYNQRYSDSGSVSLTETGRRSWSKTTKHEL